MQDFRREKKRKIKTRTIIIYLFIISVIALRATVARYESQLKEQAKATTAAWTFKLSYNDTEVETSKFDIDLADTLTTTTTDVAEGYIAPGSKGEINLTVDCTGCEVGVEYGIKILSNESIPNQLHFYLTEDYSSDSEVFLDTQYSYYLNLVEVDTIQYKSIYWQWVAEDEYSINNADMEKSGTLMSIDIEIYGEQMLQESTADSEYFKVSSNGVLTVRDDKLSLFNSVSSVIVPTEINGTEVKSIGTMAFADFKTLSNVIIQDNIIAIGEGAFYGCTGLKKVTIPTSLKEINNYAFYGCTNLESTSLEESNVTKIGNWAYQNCTGLTSVTLPSSVIEVGESAFYNCTGISDIALSTNLTSINKWTFWNCTGIATITIPDKVTKLYEGSFGQCTSLTTLSLNNTLTLIGDSAFYKCEKLQNVTLPATVITIEDYAFAECIILRKINIPTGANVAANAFEGCLYL